MNGRASWEMISARGPRIVLALWCLGLVVFGASCTGRSVPSMDVRTYAQMIRGVAEHGLPSWSNGPIDRFPALVVPWGTPANGQLWGIYGLLYPYVAAPAFRLGGLEGVSTFTFALLAPIALVTFLLARRVVKSEWAATSAAVLAIASTPIMAKAIEITAFPLTALFATLGTYFAVGAIERAERSALRGALSGVAWAMAVAAHILCFPMAIASLAVVAAAPEPAPGAGARARSLRRASARLLPALAGFVAMLLPVAYVNHLRFGSYNPISYGPIPWTGLINPELYRMNIADQARYGALPGVFVVAVAVAAFAARRRVRWLVGIVLAAFVVAALVEPLRTRLLRCLGVAYGYVVDMTLLEMGPPYDRAPDGVGRVFAGWVVKSTLQCTPLVLLAPLALRRAGERRWPLAVILAPCAALYASFAMRANLASTIDAIGSPWVYIRYTCAALPSLVVASVVVVEAMDLRVRHLVAAAALGVALTVGFASSADDSLLVKRLLLVVAPPVCALAALVVALPRRRVRGGRAIVAVTAGLGLGIALGHDLRANLDDRLHHGARVAAFERIVPRRFAFAGFLGGPFDVLLTTAATHDVEYADVQRLPDFAALGPLLHHWRTEGRPIYFLCGWEPKSEWHDVTFTRVDDVPDLYRVDFRP